MSESAATTKPPCTCAAFPYGDKPHEPWCAWSATCPDGNTACDGSVLLHGEWCKRESAAQDRTA